ncbi:MAG: hypothetical protein CBC34_017970 [Hyphomicrobiaceae bacterium TMED74]|nr:MAG: hypothetical protein CBC34_017970 [Hyphomicrobiaceae bacterium TMED74]
MPWRTREFSIRDPNGYRLWFGHSDLRAGELVEIERVDAKVRLGKRFFALLGSLAERKRLLLNESLEEIVLHSFEKIP